MLNMYRILPCSCVQCVALGSGHQGIRSPVHAVIGLEQQIRPYMEKLRGSCNIMSRLLAVGMRCLANDRSQLAWWLLARWQTYCLQANADDSLKAPNL